MIPDPPIHPWLVHWLGALATGSMSSQGPEQPNDWPSVLEDARRHGLSPLLLGTLDFAWDGEVPDVARRELSQTAAGVAARNMLLTAELRQVLLGAKARGLDCIPVRGVALGQQLYGNSAIRPTGDLDLLVRKDQLSDIRLFFGDLGYCEAEARSGFALEYYYALEFFKERHGTIVAEPRWTLAYPPLTDRLSLETVWPRCVDGDVAGVRTKLLGPEDLLIHLCLHLLHHHRGAPFLWVYEIDRVVRSRSIDWSVFLSVAREGRLEPLLLCALHRVCHVFHSPLPEEVLRELETFQRPESERRLADLLTSTSRLKGREKLATLMQLPDLRGRYRFVVSFLLPAPSFMRTQFGLVSWWQLVPMYVWRIGYLSWHAFAGVTRFVLGRRTSENSGSRSA